MTNRKFLLLTALSLFAASSFSQIRLGLTLSPTLGWFKTDSRETSSNGISPGLNYGLLFDYRIGDNERYAFSSGFQVIMSGGQLERNDTTGSDTTFTYRANLQYVAIPVTFRLRTNEIGYLTYYGQFGLTPGINVRARGTTDSNPGDTKEKQDYNPVIGFFNLALSFGAGIEYSLSGNTALLAGLFFENGIVPVVDKKEDTFLNDDEENNRTIVNTAGIKLGVFF